MSFHGPVYLCVIEWGGYHRAHEVVGEGGTLSLT